LSIDDPRLVLPAPVYRIRDERGVTRYLMREGVDSLNLWEKIDEIPLFAVPPDRKHDRLVPIYATAGRPALRVGHGEHEAGAPLFYALPLYLKDSTNSSAVVPLFKYLDTAKGMLIYSTNAGLARKGLVRTSEPLCLVWRNPSSVLALDYKAKPVPLTR